MEMETWKFQSFLTIEILHNKYYAVRLYQLQIHIHVGLQRYHMERDFMLEDKVIQFSILFSGETDGPVGICNKQNKSSHSV